MCRKQQSVVGFRYRIAGCFFSRRDAFAWFLPIAMAFALGCEKPTSAPSDLEDSPNEPEVVLPSEEEPGAGSESKAKEDGANEEKAGRNETPADNATEDPQTDAAELDDTRLGAAMEPIPGGDVDADATTIEADTAQADSVPGESDAGANERGSAGAAAAESPPTEKITLGDPSLTAGIPGSGPLTLDDVRRWIDDPKNHVPLDVQLPRGLRAAAAMISGLNENPMTRAKIELGRQLYFDTRLSSDNTVSCASCHDPSEGYSRNMPVGVGVRGQEGKRNSPVSYNRILSGRQFWDGRAKSLEDQAVGPIANPIEMGNTHEAAVATIERIPGYALQFQRIFPGQPITIDTIGQALATFERALVTGPAPYDDLEIVRSVQKQYEEDELEDLKLDAPELYDDYLEAKQVVARLSESAIRGRDLFFSEASNCTACHAGANFTDEDYHNIGVGMEAAEPDLGRYVETKQEKDKGGFKTPTLRNVVHSAPYMHDGSQETLEEVVAWYVQGGHPNPWLSDKMRKLELTEQDRADLVAFMKEALTSDFVPVRKDRLPEEGDKVAAK